MRDCLKCDLNEVPELGDTLCAECQREADFAEAILNLRGDVTQEDELEHLMAAISWLNSYCDLDVAARAFEKRYHQKMKQRDWPSSKNAVAP